jgi:MFS family permease
LNDAQPTDATGRPTNVRWCVFSLAFATSLLLYLHRYLFGFLKPKLQEEWGLTNTELGAIDSAFAFCYTVLQFPLAVAADVFGVHLMLPALIGVWCVGLGMTAWAPSPRWMWYAQSALGLGQSAVYACLNRIARTWFPAKIRTTLQGLVGILAGRLGAWSSSLIIASLLLGVLGLDWRTATWLLTASGVIHFVVFVVLFRNAPRLHPGVNDAEARLIEGGDSPSAERMTVRVLLRSVSVRSLVNLFWLSLQSLLSTFADNVYSNWIPKFLAEVHHLEFTKMGVFASLPLLGGALAGLIGGVLNDALIVRTGNRRWARVAVAFTGKFLAGLFLVAALFNYDNPYVFCGFLFFVKLVGDCSLATAWGVVADIGGKATASVFALTNSIAGIAFIASPIVYGRLADHYGWPAVFITVAATYGLCALTWLFIDCTIPVLPERSTSRE